MASFDEAKSPLTFLSIRAWARFKFHNDFDTLPPLQKIAFIDVDDMVFDRTVRRSLGRSEHKKLLLVGAHSPESDLEDNEVCAHIHADDDEVTLYYVEQLEEETYKLIPVASFGHVAFHPPFSEVGDDVERILAVIRFYFLAAGYLKELPRHKKAPKMFTKKFEQACRWIANGGEQPPALVASAVVGGQATQQPAMRAVNNGFPAINRESLARDESLAAADGPQSASVLRSATRRQQPTPVKRERRSSTIGLGQPNTPKRRALADISSNIVCASKQPSLSEKSAAQAEVAVLKAQVSTLTAENIKLKEDMAMQGHAYRGLQLELDETKDDLADMEARMNAEQANYMHLRSEMTKIKEVVNGSGV
ncbi:hypothetical protein FB567DRAFT_578516 [Paraphoma chrysanthemicola]|uniref:Uncharacterized protein n=1 Tax=Paraphoma chrysanthemicola TaxID=798071 RepID=A0A8K0VZZ5_9PLEO|nr:hypothetical protein FB567DRAFT_578516 [Paraphoma chrysanthemicola]